MSTLTLNLPNLKEEEKKDVLRLIAAKLYERGTLSLGQAAELAGMKKWDFPKVLGEYGVYYFNMSHAELAEDVKNA
jgi:predicted HTH domain antitoxin